MTTWFSKSLRLTALAIVLSAPPMLQAEDYTYTTNNGTITITKYSGSGGAVVIPGEVNGLPVTSIGDRAFNACTSLTSITIPNSVTSIGDEAFQLCTSLTSVMIGNSVTSIGDFAFDYCTSLTSVTIPNSVTSIGDVAFIFCENLTSITIPDSVTNIGAGAFDFCPNLSAITVDTLSPAFSSVDGVWFNKNQTTLMQYPGGKAGNTYGIPNSVTSIRNFAFYSCGRLTSVTIPNGVISIPDVAFAYCTGLTSVTIPDSVTSIGDFAFGGCSNLTSVMIGNSVTSIANGAFAYCTSLTAVFFEGNAPNLGATTFFGVHNATIYYNPGTKGWDATYGGLPTALWVRPEPEILRGSVAIQNNGFVFAISWATNASFVVEGSTDLANPDWVPLATNTLDNGTSHFSDLEWAKYTARFYRVRSP